MIRGRSVLLFSVLAPLVFLFSFGAVMAPWLIDRWHDFEQQAWQNREQAQQAYTEVAELQSVLLERQQLYQRFLIDPTELFESGELAICRQEAADLAIRIGMTHESSERLRTVTEVGYRRLIAQTRVENHDLTPQNYSSFLLSLAEHYRAHGEYLHILDHPLVFKGQDTLTAIEREQLIDLAEQSNKAWQVYESAVDRLEDF